MKRNLIFSLSSIILLVGCITVKNIDNKDSKNNKFSDDLQLWFAIKHPQKIDSSVTVIHDTTQDPYVQVDTAWERWDSLLMGQGVILSPDTSSFYVLKGSAYYQIHKMKFDTLWRADTIRGPIKVITKTVFKYIHDSTIVVKINESQLKAYKTSLDNLTVKYSDQVLATEKAKNSGLKYLIWAIVATALLGLSSYFNFKKLIP